MVALLSKGIPPAIKDALGQRVRHTINHVWKVASSVASTA